MPKFKTFRGPAPARLIQEINDKLHIAGHVYRTSDLSELFNVPPMMQNDPSTPSALNISWSLRLSRGYQPYTRQFTLCTTPHAQMNDFDLALCGRWAGVRQAGYALTSDKIRQYISAAFNGGFDFEISTGNISNIHNQTALTNTTNMSNDQLVFLPSGSGGSLLMGHLVSASGGASCVQSVLAGADPTTVSTALFGTTSAASNSPYLHRVMDEILRWYFIETAAYVSASSTLAIRAVLKSSMAGTTLAAALATPAGATAVGATGLGYSNSGPSYAYLSGTNELSSYVLWRTATNMEIHRVQISGIDGNPTVTNNLVTLDQNPMVVSGTTTTPSTSRILMVNHSDGKNYLVVMSFETNGITGQASAETMYVYKLTDKNTATYVGSYQLAVGPRSALTADDTGMRFAMIYDDRFEFWTMGAGGVLGKGDTVFNARINSTQYYLSEPYGFDSTGRFWYISGDSQKPAIISELGLNYVSPPGQTQTVVAQFDAGNYTYSGSPINANLSIAVKDITGAYIATTVNLTASANLTLSANSVQTLSTGPVNVPITITGPGDITVDART